jgi:hypothetical protein
VTTPNPELGDLLDLYSAPFSSPASPELFDATLDPDAQVASWALAAYTAAERDRWLSVTT